MNRSNLSMVLIWIGIEAYTVVDAVSKPLSVSSGISNPFGYSIALLPFALVVLTLFSNAMPGEKTIGPFLDGAFGTGWYRSYLLKLRPYLLMSLCSFSYVAVLLIRDELFHAGQVDLVVCSFFLSASVACLILHYVAVRRWH